MGRAQRFVFQLEFNEVRILETLHQNTAFSAQYFNRLAACAAYGEVLCGLASLTFRQFAVGIDRTCEFTQTGHFISPYRIFPTSAAAVVCRGRSASPRGCVRV